MEKQHLEDQTHSSILTHIIRCVSQKDTPSAVITDLLPHILKDQIDVPESFKLLFQKAPQFEEFLHEIATQIKEPGSDLSNFVVGQGKSPTRVAQLLRRLATSTGEKKNDKTQRDSGYETEDIKQSKESDEPKKEIIPSQQPDKIGAKRTTFHTAIGSVLGLSAGLIGLPALSDAQTNINPISAFVEKLPAFESENLQQLKHILDDAISHLNQNPLFEFVKQSRIPTENEIKMLMQSGPDDFEYHQTKPDSKQIVIEFGRDLGDFLKWFVVRLFELAVYISIIAWLVPLIEMKNEKKESIVEGGLIGAAATTGVVLHYMNYYHWFWHNVDPLISAFALAYGGLSIAQASSNSLGDKLHRMLIVGSATTAYFIIRTISYFT